MVPAGWQDANGVLIAPNRFACVHGFRDWVLANNAKLGVPITEEWTEGLASCQIFTNGALYWSGIHGVVEMPIGTSFIETLHPPTAALKPIPIPSPSQDPNKAKLAKTQAIMGTKTVSLYIGVNVHGRDITTFRAPDFAAIAREVKSWGVDSIFVKFGENGILWYDGTQAQIKAAIEAEGVQCFPFWYMRPGSWAADTAHCVALAKLFKIIACDSEEVFLNHGTELYEIFNAISTQCPESVLIADAYGDPTSAFGTAFPDGAFKVASMYQPQFYGSIWGARDWVTWNSLLNNADMQCSNEFARVGMGRSFPIRPNFSCWNTSISVAYNLGRWARSFDLGATIWEHDACNAQFVAALKKGLIS